MATTTTVRHHSSVDLHHACSVEASLVTTDLATEVYLRFAPVASATCRNACKIQSRVLYDALDEVLHGLSAQPDHVLIEKAYLRNLAGDREDFETVRQDFYRKRGLTGIELPALACLGQPSCHPGVDIEMQIYAIVPHSPESVNVLSCPPPCEDGSLKIVEIGRARHLILTNLTGLASNGEPDGFRKQCDRVFAMARNTLAEHGATFSDVFRNWLYLDDISLDYAELNASRNSFFQSERVQRLPASTAVGAATHPATARCALDLCAILDPKDAEREQVTAPALCDPSKFDAAFSRATKLASSDSTHLFVSATPGVDENGQPDTADDAGHQMERMLANLEKLLEAQGAGWDGLVQAVTYLTSAEHLERYEELCGARGITEVPHTIVRADLCRPDLVSEMEAVAVLPAT